MDASTPKKDALELKVKRADAKVKSLEAELEAFEASNRLRPSLRLDERERRQGPEAFLPWTGSSVLQGPAAAAEDPAEGVSFKCSV